MMKKKSSGSEKKRKRSQSRERRDNEQGRRSELIGQVDTKDELADAELDRISSDMEEGGLDLSQPFQPITDYVTDKREMLEQCFRVLGEKKLHKMLPDELKDYSLEEIKNLCWEQLEPISEMNLIEILAGEDVTAGHGDKNTEETLESQQDNNVDSTSCLKDTSKSEDPKQEAGGSGEESDVLSINADTYDSDIEGPKEEQPVKPADRPVKSGGGSGDPASIPDPAPPKIRTDLQRTEAKKDIQSDIDKSVCEILALSDKDVGKEQIVAPPCAELSSAGQGRPAPSCTPTVSQPSVQQLELLELEMRARAIKALMKASEMKKASVAKNS